MDDVGVLAPVFGWRCVVPSGCAIGRDMSALTRQPDSAFAAPNWQPDVVQMLDESHLVAVSPLARSRTLFAVSLAQFLQGLREAEVCTLYGRFVTDLESYCHQLERAITGPTLERRIDGPRGVTALLRWRETYRGRPASKFRFYIWHDADVLLHANERLFARLAETMMGVAAEAEYASDDLLLLHRTVFVGGPVLAAYAQQANGPMQEWLAEPGQEPFWQVVSGLERPRTQRYEIDTLAIAR